MWEAQASDFAAHCNGGPRKIDATDGLIENIFTKAKAANRTLRDDEVLDIIKRHEA